MVAIRHLSIVLAQMIVLEKLSAREKHVTPSDQDQLAR